MKPLTCRRCGSTFDHPRPGTPGRPPVLCSDECRQANRRDYTTGRQSARRLRGECIDCKDATVQPALPGTNFCPEHTGRRAAAADRAADARHRRYGLTSDELAGLYAAQEGRCAICKRTEHEVGGRRFAIDHNHACCAGDSACGSCVRGLLCHGCNTGIGFLGDDPERLQAAARYVSRSS